MTNSARGVVLIKVRTFSGPEGPNAVNGEHLTTERGALPGFIVVDSHTANGHNDSSVAA